MPDLTGPETTEQLLAAEIARRQQVEAALRESEERFAKAFQHSPLAMVISTVSDGRICDANESFLRLFEITREAILGRQSVELDMWADPEDRSRAAELLCQQGCLRNFEVPIRAAGGAIIDVLLSVDMLQLAAEPCMITSLYDITARKQADIALRESEQRYRQIVETSLEGIWLINAESNTTFVNAMMAEILGYSADEMIGMSLFAFMDEEGQAIAAANVERRREGVEEQHDFKFRRKDGSEVWALLSTNPFQDSAGVYAGALAMVTDITDRKRSEQALRQSEERFAKAFRANPAALVIFRRTDGCFVEANETYQQLLGYSHAELIGQSARDLNIFPDPGTRTEMLRRLDAHGALHDFEIIVRTKSDEHRTILLSSEAVELGGEACVLAIGIDITDRKRAEEALRESEANLKKSQAVAHVGHWSWDTRTNQLVWSEEMHRIFGIDPLSFSGDLGAVIEQAIHPDDQEKVAHANELVIKKQRSAALEYRVIWADQTVHTVWAIPDEKVVDDSGMIIRLTGIVQDITERKHIEVALQRYTQRLEVLANASRAFAEVGAEYQVLLDQIAQTTAMVLGEGCSIRMISDDGMQLPLAALYDVDPEQLKIHRIVLGDAPLRMDEPSLSWQIVQSQQSMLVPVVDQKQVRAATKPEFWSLVERLAIHSMLVVPLRVRGQTIGILGLYRYRRAQPSFNEDDLTLAQDLADRAALAISNAHLFQQVQAELAERAKAEAEVRALSVELEQRVAARTSELTAANKELEAFSYSISHDLRAPLRAINGFSRILLEDYAAALPEEAQHYLRRVCVNADQMGHLIDDLLSFSRLSRQPLSRYPIAHAELVRQCVEDLRDDQKGRQITIHIDNLPDCAADPALLRQVWINLIANAIKYTRRREHAQIEIGSQTEGAATIYFIRDNGVGFDMRYSDKLFGVFQRMHRAEDYEGTGVGLAIVQRVIIRHHGRIWAEAAVDQGATFFFTIMPEPDAAG